MKKQVVVLVLAAVLVFGCAVGGTLAWLIDSTETVTNTFTVGDVDIELTETTGDEYKMIPGATIKKNPTVSVSADSEDCYVFVKIDKIAAYGQFEGDGYTNKAVDEFLTITLADGWTAVEGVAGVYYREVATNDDVREFSVLANNEITVRDDVTKSDVNALNAQFATDPALAFTAYAVQKTAAADAAAAWTLANAQ